MKNIILLSLLLLPLMGFSQTNRDSIIMLNKQTNPTLLLNSATNLIDAGKSYQNADNFLLLGVTSAIIGSLIYTKVNQVNKGYGLAFIMGGVFLNINSIFERYDGHKKLKQSGKDLINYSKSLEKL